MIGSRPIPRVERGALRNSRWLSGRVARTERESYRGWGKGWSGTRDRLRSLAMLPRTWLVFAGASERPLNDRRLVRGRCNFCLVLEWPILRETRRFRARRPRPSAVTFNYRTHLHYGRLPSGLSSTASVCCLRLRRRRVPSHRSSFTVLSGKVSRSRALAPPRFAPAYFG